MIHRITILPHQQNISAPAGSNLLEVLRARALAPEAPCGGSGRCGKCRVLVDGTDVPACRTVIDRDMTVTLPAVQADQILTGGIAPQLHRTGSGCLLAFDIGTTTVAGYLLDGRTGGELACESRSNPQAAFGADVISRIRHAVNGQLEALTRCIQQCVTELALALCRSAGIDPARIRLVSLVGNPAMQQLYLGICPDNLARIPFAPVLTRTEAVPAGEYLPLCPRARLLIVPDISGFVGADTVAGILAAALDRQTEMTLLADIGTNGEMVLGNRHRMTACSTAAGPTLEGANIRCGMRGQTGAIDHVWLENSEMKYSVIGGGKARGICGSGLIDAAAAALELGLLNQRGRILNSERLIRLSDAVYLTQEDIRQLQTAKGAIAAGIELMAAHLGITPAQINNVYLAGAFGTFLNPASACRIGLLPPVLAGRIESIGNAAGSGAKLLALDPEALDHAQALVSRIESIDLASAPEFSRSFARNMRF